MRREYVCLVLSLGFAACDRDSSPRAESAEASARAVASPKTPARNPQAASGDPSGDSPAGDGVVTVSESGIGPVHFGMTLFDARAATGNKLSAPPAADTASCGFARWTGGPAGVRLMTSKGRIVRVDVDSGSTTAVSGAHIGDSEKRIIALYDAGSVEVTPSKYTAGHDITIQQREGTGSIRYVYQTDGKRVTRFRAGRMPEVGYVEGCG